MPSAMDARSTLSRGLPNVLRLSGDDREGERRPIQALVGQYTANHAMYLVPGGKKPAVCGGSGTQQNSSPQR
jgi:hypothetical protein